MRLGVSLAQSGRLADPAAIRSAAMGAEQVGYSSLWVVDRLGRDRPDLSTVLDPITVLTYAAACTSRVRLGTSVLVAPWYAPVLLARTRIGALLAPSAGVPAVGNMTPLTGPPGTVLQLTGSNFAGLTSVQFGGGVTAAFSVASDTTATVTPPRRSE